MIEALGLWVAPLLLIPGKALLTISSGAQFNQLTAFHKQYGDTVALTTRLTLVRRALVALYVGIAVDSIAGLCGGLLGHWPEVASVVIIVLSCIGVGCLLVATGLLVAEISVSLQSIH